MDAHDVKILVAGAFGAGKTTLIQQVSQTPVVGTEQPTSGTEATVKATTTVGMEYGTYAVVDEDVAVHLDLYGVPGQDRFSFMWDILGEGMDGLVLLVDAANPGSWAEAAAVGRHFRDRWAPPTVVAVNRATDGSQVEAVRVVLGLPDAPHLACDVTDPTSARAVLIEVLLTVLAHPTHATDDLPVA